MKKLNGSNLVKTAVFISGSGTNLNSLIKFSYTHKSPIKIKYVISDNINANGLNIAKKFNIKNKFYDFKKNKNVEKKILGELKKNNIKFICLAGFMKILSKNFIYKFKGQIINIHPSLLPQYKGLNTHNRVIKNKEKNSGCTVHFVNSRLDSGKIILQKKVKILKKDTPKSLSRKILKEEHILYPKAILKIFSSL
tara:strand:+ start:392 stop:976 length:585 start_codon:yes stop_codon:yes gene_type:complete